VVDECKATDSVINGETLFLVRLMTPMYGAMAGQNCSVGTLLLW